MKKFIDNKLSSVMLGIAGLLLFIGLWDLYSIYKDYSLFPRANEIVKQLLKVISSKEFISNFTSTIKLALLGTLYATIFGILLGTAIAESKILNKLISPLINSLRGVAGISLFPILIVIFGIGDASRIVVIFWTAWPSILMSTYRNLLAVDKEVLEASQVFGAGRWTTLIRIKFPLSTLGILNGIKIGVGSGWISLVVAEMLGASKGLGYMLNWSAQTFRFAESYAYIVIISAVLGIITAILDAISKWLERKIY